MSINAAEITDHYNGEQWIFAYETLLSELNIPAPSDPSFVVSSFTAEIETKKTLRKNSAPYRRLTGSSKRMRRKR